MDVHFKALSLHPSSFFPIFPSLHLLFLFLQPPVSFCIITSEHNCFWSGDSNVNLISYNVVVHPSSLSTFDTLKRFSVQSTSSIHYSIFVSTASSSEEEYKDYRSSFIPFPYDDDHNKNETEKRMRWRKAKYIHSSQWSQNQKRFLKRRFDERNKILGGKHERTK